jgi:hypothetical protein
VIVRIATEGQYELREDDAAVLGELDNEAVATCQAGDEQRFRGAYARVIDFIRTNGRPVPEDQLLASDMILPPPDVSLEEASKKFSGEGLIPG